MNWVPLLFFDDVCHQLPKPTFNHVTQLSGSWSEFGAEHHKKRRELEFVCQVNDQEVNYSFRETTSKSELTVADLNLKFDRITDLACDSSNHRVSLSAFQNVLLPTVASLVANCCWWYHAPKRSAQNRIFFNAFKNCPGFNEINVQEQGEESRHFLVRQVELGNVETLALSGSHNWPEEEKLTETLKIFVSSTRFHKLYSPDLLTDDYELFELFLERALASELKPGAYIVTHARNFDKNRLLALHPECRRDSEKAEWRIPDSNLRIALSHYTGMLYVNVE